MADVIIKAEGRDVGLGRGRERERGPLEPGIAGKRFLSAALIKKHR